MVAIQCGVFPIDVDAIDVPTTLTPPSSHQVRTHDLAPLFAYRLERQRCAIGSDKVFRVASRPSVLASPQFPLDLLQVHCRSPLSGMIAGNDGARTVTASNQSTFMVRSTCLASAS